MFCPVEAPQLADPWSRGAHAGTSPGVNETFQVSENKLNPFIRNSTFFFRPRAFFLEAIIPLIWLNKKNGYETKNVGMEFLYGGRMRMEIKTRVERGKAGQDSRLVSIFSSNSEEAESANRERSRATDWVRSWHTRDSVMPNT